MCAKSRALPRAGRDVVSAAGSHAGLRGPGSSRRAPGRARRLSADTPVLLSSACIGAQDPYCGWDVAMKKCTSLEESLSMTQWEQTISACPVSGRVLGPQSTPSREPRCPAVTPRVGTASTRGHGPPSPAHPVCAHSAQAALSLEESHLDAGMSSGSV